MDSILQAVIIWMTLVAVIAMIAVVLLLPSTWRRLAVAGAAPTEAAHAGTAGAVPASAISDETPAVDGVEAHNSDTHTVELTLIRTTPADDADADVARYAGEVAVAAQRAAATAARRRGEWEIASDAVDDAWAAYDEADRAAKRLAAAAAYPMISKRRTRTENVDRRRYLHRAATAACRRHEISIAQLNEILAHRGWNPRLHPVAQEAALGRAIRAYRFETWQRACARERAAWQTAETAAAALAHLRAEAVAAQVAEPAPTSEASWWAEQWDSTVPIRSTVDSRHPVAA